MSRKLTPEELDGLAAQFEIERQARQKDSPILVNLTKQVNKAMESLAALNELGDAVSAEVWGSIEQSLEGLSTYWQRI